MTEEDLAELERAEQRFARLARALRAREPGDDRRSLTTEWMHANHGFHDVIYRVADMPYIEQVAKSARRTFSGPAVWAPGDETIDELYLANERQHRCDPGRRRRPQPRRRPGARPRARALLVPPARDDPRSGRGTTPGLGLGRRPRGRRSDRRRAPS